jgi:hypothetical protein
MSNDLALKDIEAGRVRSISKHSHGYNAEHFDTPNSHSSFTGFTVTPELQKAITDHKVPFFDFETKESSLLMAGLYPVIREYQNCVAPWAAIDRVPTEIGHSILALGADRTENFEPLKLPLALFSDSVQNRLLALSKAVNKENALVQLPIRDAKEFPDNPVGYFNEVVSKIMPDELKAIAENLKKSHTKIQENIDKLDGLKDEPGESKIFSQRLVLTAQMNLLKNHYSTLNEKILLGKANNWSPKQTLDHVQKAIRFENAGEKEIAKTHTKETHPHVHARAFLADRIDQYLDSLLGVMSKTFIM